MQICGGNIGGNLFPTEYIVGLSLKDPTVGAWLVRTTVPTNVFTKRDHCGTSSLKISSCT